MNSLLLDATMLLAGEVCVHMVINSQKSRPELAQKYLEDLSVTSKSDLTASP